MKISEQCSWYFSTDCRECCILCSHWIGISAVRSNEETVVHKKYDIIWNRN